MPQMRPDVNDLKEQKCPECGRAKSQWRTNSSKGHRSNGIAYCCEGCAKGTACICELRQGALSPTIDEAPDNIAEGDGNMPL